MSTGPRGGRSARRGSARSARWLPPLGKNTWYLAIAATAVLGLTAGGVALLAGSSGGPTHEASPDCGLINCGASLPGPSTTIATQSHVGKAHTTVSHAPAAPAKSAPPASSAPSPASTPAGPTPTEAANVSVTFSSGGDRRDFGHFQEQMTLVNNGGRPVSGWTVQLTLPGDGVDSVEIPSGWDGVPFEHWQFNGDTLTISADTGSETLGPGAPLNLSIHGQGNTSSPTGCTFNGTECPTPTLGEQDQQQPPPSGQQAGQQAPESGQQAAESGQQAPESGQQPTQPGQWPGQPDWRSGPSGGQWPGTGQPYR
jgi:Cellulose binding domain